MRNISILGSTGSIGTQTLDIVRDNDDINVCALAAGSNIDLLEKQIREFKPKVVSVWDSDKAEELKKRVRDTDVDIYTGMNGLITAATVDSADIVVLAVV